MTATVLDPPRQAAPDLKADYLAKIRAGMAAHPRSQQVRIGPSELGTPCPRHLLVKLAGADHSDGDRWIPTIGTALHAWVEKVFAADDRFLTELPVAVGTVGGQVITGTCDLYDRQAATITDWKFVGADSLKKYRADQHPGEQYAAQVDLYGVGVTALGLPVEHVQVAFIPRFGAMSDPLLQAWFWTRPHDPEHAAKVLARADQLAALLSVLGLAGALAWYADAPRCTSPWCSQCAAPPTPKEFKWI